MYLYANLYIYFFLTLNVSFVLTFWLDSGYKHMVKELEALSEGRKLPKSVINRIIIQPVDHFNSSENRKWEMRYWEDTDLWTKDGPILLYIGGEGEMSPWSLTEGTFLFELAKEMNAAMFASEHRYYGASIPLDKTEVDRLKYLTSRQALADIEYLLNYIRSLEQYRESKVVVVGGSYAGSLAVWMKLLYPELVTAALASSAPVLAKMDFYEYLETVSDDYKQFGLPGCHDRVESIFNRYEKLLKTSEGMKQLKQEENICDTTDLTREENKAIFFLSQVRTFQMVSQYGSPEDIKEHCKQLLSTSGIVNKDNSDDCQDYNFETGVKYLKYDPWFYQTCNEFGYYQTTSPTDNTFGKGIPVGLFVEYCSAVFGKEYTKNKIEENVKNTNMFYNGLKPNVKHVIFTNSEMDPWKNLGVRKNLSQDDPAIMVHRMSHCSDLGIYKDTDSQELNETRRHNIELLKQWIKF